MAVITVLLSIIIALILPWYEKHQKVYLIDVAIPGKSRISQKCDVILKIEVARLWRTKKVL